MSQVRSAGERKDGDFREDLLCRSYGAPRQISPESHEVHNYVVLVDDDQGVTQRSPSRNYR